MLLLRRGPWQLLSRIRQRKPRTARMLVAGCRGERRIRSLMRRNAMLLLLLLLKVYRVSVWWGLGWWGCAQGIRVVNVAGVEVLQLRQRLRVQSPVGRLVQRVEGSWMQRPQLLEDG